MKRNPMRLTSARGTPYYGCMEANRTAYDQTIIEARNAAGHVKLFAFGIYTPREDAESNARAFAGHGGAVRLAGRNRLNDYVGSPIWSDPQTIEIL